MSARHLRCLTWMSSTIESLLALQELESKSPTPKGELAKEIERLRSEIPEPLLRAFDRFAGRKKKPVATVRHRVCSECHLQIPVGILGSLAFGQGIQHCGNCGRFLYLPEDEPLGAPEDPAKIKAARPGKKSALPRT